MPYKNKDDLYKAQKRHREKIKQKLFDFLSTKKCIDCEESDPVVLEFDHIDPNGKFKSISTMRSGHYSWASVSREMIKCEIRCANCHRRRTNRQIKKFGALEKIRKKN